jgi:hypothetical protein
MRRFFLGLAAVGLLGGAGILQAGEQVAAVHGQERPAYVQYGGGPEYATYGRRLRGGFGKNGYAPVCGPFWGPNAFAPWYSQSPPVRPNGAYVRNPYLDDGMIFPPHAGPDQVDRVEQIGAKPRTLK